MAKKKGARQDAEPEKDGQRPDGTGTEASEEESSSTSEESAASADSEAGADTAGESGDEETDATAAENLEQQSAAPAAEAPIAASPACERYVPTHRTLTAEVAQLSREALKDHDYTAHAELHAIEMAVAHLRQAALKAASRVKGDTRGFIDLLLASL